MYFYEDPFENHGFPFKNSYFILNVWEFCLHGCMCTLCVPGALQGQERALDFLTLELALAVSHHVDAWEINTVTLQEQQVLLTVESSLQPDDFLIHIAIIVLVAIISWSIYIATIIKKCRQPNGLFQLHLKKEQSKYFLCSFTRKRNRIREFIWLLWTHPARI